MLLKVYGAEEQMCILADIKVQRLFENWFGIYPCYLVSRIYDIIIRIQIYCFKIALLNYSFCRLFGLTDLKATTEMTA